MGWETTMKKAVASTIILLLAACFLLSQSLVEVAKKEKERRANLKEKRTTVVTNEVLEKKKLEPSLSIRSPDPSAMENSAISEMPESRSMDHILSQTPSGKDQTAFFDLASLEAKWNEAQEQVALLTLQLNALWHKYRNMNDMTAPDLIRQQISETYLRLQKARADADQLKKDLEKARREKRTNPSENR
jgi:hypothetical protein